MKLVVFLSAVALLGGCASVGSNKPDPTQLRLAALESENQAQRDELAEQRRLLNGFGAVGMGSSVAQLEEQARQLRGQIEELQYKLSMQEDRQRALYLDLDNRLQALEGGTTTPGSGRPRNSSEAGDGDQKAYLAAFQQLKSGAYPEAVAGFQNFLRQYPESPYAPNAQYWIGEAHYVQRNFDQAWSAFAVVLERFPASPKASDALLKQGLLRVEQGQPVQARELLKKTIQSYPDSTAASLAKERLQQMGGS